VKTAWLTLGRRRFLASSSIASLAAIAARAAAVGEAATSRQRQPVFNRAPLAGQPFSLLPTGSIRPTGWLKDQMRIQADGMGGHLDEFWPDVGPNSGWLGGTGESWERGPYFVDGLLPLAWALDDAALKAKAQRFIDWTLDHPWPNGMIGPTSNDDWWPRMVMLKVLAQYHELTEDPRVIPVMTAYFHHQLEALPARPLKDWGKFRWQDELLSVLWLYNRTGDEALLRLAALLGAQGWDWKAEFADFPFTSKVTPKEIGFRWGPDGKIIGNNGDKGLSAHGVNNAMAIKTAPLWSLVAHDGQGHAALMRQLDLLDRYHGLPIGIFSADEHLAGHNPSQGVELCAVVETLFSLEHALAVTGDASLADRIERIAFNALPAPFTDHMWAHQYDQQPNQIECSQRKGPWTTNDDESNLFGLEPHFGCCTANFHQGWPKLAASLWMASDDGGLAAMVYAPCEIDTVVHGIAVRVAQVTDYPFRDEVAITLQPVRPVAFPLKLRMPGWSRSTTVRINGRLTFVDRKGGFATIERTWRAGDRVDIAFDIRTRAEQGYHGAVSVTHGALLFANERPATWTKLRDHGPVSDWQVTSEAPWNFGLDPEASLALHRHARASTPFTRRAPPVSITVGARPVANWSQTSNYADPPPQDAVAGGDEQLLTLIPYGAAKLRISAFPSVQGKA
jgi:hypothetical protein